MLLEKDASGLEMARKGGQDNERHRTAQGSCKGHVCATAPPQKPCGGVLQALFRIGLSLKSALAAEAERPALVPSATMKVSV